MFKKGEVKEEIVKRMGVFKKDKVKEKTKEVQTSEWPGRRRKLGRTFIRPSGQRKYG